jgi:predicted protein tyrosine phosphatase
VAEYRNGLSAELNHDAASALIPGQIDWADIMFIMERNHRNRLGKRFRKHLNGKRVICLGIPDEYEFMETALICLLEAEAGRFLRSS